jgi:hypothetical protein
MIREYKGETMKITRAGTASGCVIWIIVFSILSASFLPAAMLIVGFRSVSNFAIRVMGPIICRGGTTAEAYSYAKTTTAEFGNSQPSTAYEIHCIDANRTVVKEDPLLYALLRIGIIAIIGLVIAALLAFVLAAPAALLIVRVLDRKKTNFTANIEPE